MPGLSGNAQIAMEVVDVYAVRSDGTVWAWGYNQSGQLGNGATTASYSPAQVPGLTGITQVLGRPRLCPGPAVQRHGVGLG